jgi:glycosyltransferase involved in cell wall biosynthesis
VVVPTYNYAAYIAEALAGVLAQEYEDYEVIVVDDGSDDDTHAVVGAMARRFEGRLFYLYHRHRSVAVARNAALAVARGRYVAFLDADDVWMPSALSAMVRYLESHPDEGVVYGNTEYFEHRTGEPLGLLFSRASIKRPHAGRCLEPMFLRGNFIPMMASMMRREVCEAAGGFDRRLRAGEDYLFWMRIASRCRIGYLDEVLCRVRRHGRNLTFQSTRHAFAHIKVTRSILESAPGLRAALGEQALRKKWYHVYYGLGMSLVLDGKPARARRYLRGAWRMRANPFISKIALYYVLSFVGQVRWLVRCRDALHRMRARVAREA